jgi:hypothetical protein
MLGFSSEEWDQISGVLAEIDERVDRETDELFGDQDNPQMTRWPSLRRRCPMRTRYEN